MKDKINFNDPLELENTLRTISLTMSTQIAVNIMTLNNMNAKEPDIHSLTPEQTNQEIEKKEKKNEKSKLLNNY